jgi:peptidyl-prolyl cis-trans isomerase B (cyclophilin B)
MNWNIKDTCLVILWLALIGPFCSAPLDPSVEEETPTAVEEAPTGKPVAIIDTSQGQIVVALLDDIAPKTVRHFVELAELGFYSRTTFHRVIAGDMIQGGSPTSRDNDPYNDGQGTTGETIAAEISDHEFDRGTVAMAHRPGNRDSGSCQFFIVLRRIPEWDREYTAFGKVLEGIEVVEKISNSPLSKSTHPTLKQRPAGKQLIKSITIEYRDLE